MNHWECLNFFGFYPIFSNAGKFSKLCVNIVKASNDIFIGICKWKDIGIKFTICRYSIKFRFDSVYWVRLVAIIMFIRPSTLLEYFFWHISHKFPFPLIVIFILPSSVHFKLFYFKISHLQKMYFWPLSPISFSRHRTQKRVTMTVSQPIKKGGFSRSFLVTIYNCCSH